MFKLKQDNNGIMIALMLNDQLSRHISNYVSDVKFPKGSEVLPYRDHHITLLYFEKGEVDIASLKEVLKQFSWDLEGYYIDYVLHGIDIFYNADKKAVYIPVYNGSVTNNVTEFQRELATRVGFGLKLPNSVIYRYNRFRPHVTVAYIPTNDWNYLEPLSGMMNSVYTTTEVFTLMNGNDRVDYRFNFNL